MRLWMKSPRMCNAARRHGDAMSSAIDPTGRPLLTGLDQLPGDPSLVLNVNVNLGEGKPAFMASASKAISSALSKPESFVAVCVNDGVDILFGGTSDPAAVGCVYSLGSINQANNA